MRFLFLFFLSLILDVRKRDLVRARARDMEWGVHGGACWWRMEVGGVSVWWEGGDRVCAAGLHDLTDPTLRSSDAGRVMDIKRSLYRGVSATLSK